MTGANLLVLGDPGQVQMEENLSSGNCEDSRPGKEKLRNDQIRQRDDETFLVQFEANDPEHPLNWPKKLKWGITAAVSGTGFLRIMVSTVSRRQSL